MNKNEINAWDEVESYFKDILGDKPFAERVELRRELKSKFGIINKITIAEVIEAMADEAGYPKSDKTRFETTYWTQRNIWVKGFRTALKLLTCILLLTLSSCTTTLWQRQIDPVTFKPMSKWQPFRIDTTGCNKFFEINRFPGNPRQ